MANKKTSSSKVNFSTAVTNFWTHYFDFTGRASRSEFWFGMLFVLIANYLFMAMFGTLIATIVSAILFIPTLSLSTRRFRDAGVWVWLYLIPVLIIYVLPILRGATWYKMISINRVTPDMFGYSLFFVAFLLFWIVVGCLPSRR
jgi:uncharacterized membrane protein YhaH (DUF805 family)